MRLSSASTCMIFCDFTILLPINSTLRAVCRRPGYIWARDIRLMGLPAEKVVDADPENPRELRQKQYVWHRVAALPLADRLVSHAPSAARAPLESAPRRTLLALASVAPNFSDCAASIGFAVCHVLQPPSISFGSVYQLKWRL